MEKSAEAWANVPNSSDGLKIKELFAAIASSTDEAAISRNFMWRVLLSRPELDFYLNEEEARNSAPKVSSAKQTDLRGFCNNLEHRVRVNQFIRDAANKRFSECVSE